MVFTPLVNVTGAVSTPFINCTFVIKFPFKVILTWFACSTFSSCARTVNPALLTLNPELLGCIIEMVGALHGVNTNVFVLTSVPQLFVTASDTEFVPATSVKLAFNWPLLKVKGTPTPLSNKAI